MLNSVNVCVLTSCHAKTSPAQRGRSPALLVTPAVYYWVLLKQQNSSKCGFSDLLSSDCLTEPPGPSHYKDKHIQRTRSPLKALFFFKLTLWIFTIDIYQRSHDATVILIKLQDFWTQTWSTNGLSSFALSFHFAFISPAFTLCPLLSLHPLCHCCVLSRLI